MEAIGLWRYVLDQRCSTLSHQTAMGSQNTLTDCKLTAKDTAVYERRQVVGGIDGKIRKQNEKV